MASGFLLADALAEALRKPYHQGDTNITVQYLVEGLKIGEYRVMLKRNFDTACWLPPVGSRGSHSIYYGDRMLDRIFDRFVKVEAVEGMPTKKDFVAKVKAANEAAKAEAAAKGKRFKPALPPLTQVFNARLEWLKANLSAAQWDKLMEWILKAVASYGRHEREHARNTPQDMKQVNRDLRILGIPFQYFNLFEDSRIEHISRQELGIDFEWLVFEDIAPADNPWNMYLRCIQLEGATDQEALDNESPFDKSGGGTRTIGIVAESVETYYKRAIACTTAEQLYPIIKEFLEEFKDDLPPPPDGEEGEEGGSGGSGSGSGKGKGKKGGEGEGEGEGSGEDEDDDEYNGAGERAGDLSTAAEAADKGDEFLEEFDADSEIVGGTDAEGKDAEAKAKGKLKGDGTGAPPKGPGSKAQGIPESIAPQASGGRATERYFLTERPGSIDAAYQKRVDHLTTLLMRMFKTHSLPAATEAPGRRMSGRHLAHGELKFIHKKVFGGKGKRRYSIVYDCSGSMGGRPDREGKLFLLALNNLAKRGFLEGNLILSGWVNGRPGWLSYAFPVKDELILRIHPHHSSEGLQSALADNLKSIMGMDDVFVYTDACICDAPLDRGFFASRRIWPVGLYVGDDDAASEMERHFPQNIIRKHIEEVVEAMLTRNRRTVG